jgi:hypothetical protein
LPTIAPALTAAIIAAGPTLKGPSFFKLAAAVGQGVSTWLLTGPAATVMVGSVNGTAGAGVVNGKVFVAPLVPAMTAAFAANGMVGPTAAKLAMAVTMGVANNINATGTYKGSAAGVGAGADISKVTFANTASLVPILVGSFASKGMVGPSAIKLANAIAVGTCAVLMTGTGTGAVTGPTGPAPSTGVSTCSIL